MKKERKAEYIFRYYLPTSPYFDAEYTERRFDELLAFCKETQTQSVMFYVSLDPNFYYMPDTLAYTRQTRDELLPYIEKLKQAGISYQINYQNLIGSISGGADFSKQLGYEPLVDYKGYFAGGVACPLGKNFRKIAAEKLRIWAATNPDIFWLDDDLRMHNHGSPHFGRKEGWYVDNFCFCDEHIRLFNKKLGKNYTRAEIVSGILQEGEPTQMRRDYLTFMNETTTEFAAWIEQTIHSVSPNVRIAQMTSAPDSHSTENRNWGDFLSALSGKHSAIVRPHYGPYRESLPRDFVSCYKVLAQSICNMRETYKNHIDFCPEIENTRFTVWAKSARATAFQLMLSAFMGCNNITLSLYDLDGCSLNDEPSYKEMLIKNKSKLDFLAELPLDQAKSLGVIIPTSGEAGMRYRLKNGENYAQLTGFKRYIENYFLQAGIPCQYRSIQELEGQGVVALDGYTAGFLSDEEIIKLLGGNVFLEGAAMEELLSRGFGQYIGVEKVQKSTIQTNVEIVKSFARTDGTHIRIPSRIPPNNWYSAEVAQGTELLSTFNTPLGGEYPALTLYKNAIGGQVATYFASGNLGDGFFTHYRIKLLKDVLQRLDGTLDRLDCHAYALYCVRQCEKGIKYHFVANLSTDTMREFSINGVAFKTNLEPYETVIVKDGVSMEILDFTRGK